LTLPLFYIMQADTEGFISMLKELPGVSGLYFRPVEAVTAFNPDTFTAFPTPAPVDTSGGGDKGGDDDIGVPVLVFAIVGGVLVLGSIVLGAWFVSQRSTVAASAPDSPATPGSSYPSKQVSTQSDSATVPVANAASRLAVAPASVAVKDAGSNIDSSAVHSGASIMESSDAGDMSYTYSLDAGNLDQQTYATGLSGAGALSTLEGDQSTEVSGRPNMVSREVVAPPGKLGIVIDTTLEGPVVHKVNPGSPLDGIVSPGDIIVAIDNVDTRAMSASAITALMVKTANQERRMTILSEDDAES
jgi:hypothetical protein